MKLVDIAYTAKERKEEAQDMVPGKGKGPEYPWGLSLTLDEETLGKLGIEGLPATGDEFRVEALAKVVNVSSTDDDGEPERSVRLQITELACEPDGAEQVSSKAGTSSKPKRTVASYYSEGKQ